jgi:hypothetical protein
MDEKTEELRDIFVDVAGEEAVTESQEESPGSLTTDEDGVDDRIAAVVERMRDRYELDSGLDDDSLVTVVRGFYDGEDDAAIAADIAGANAADDVFRARLDLHLFRDEDTEAPFDLAPLRKRADDDVETLAADLDVSPEAVRHYRRVVTAQNEARQVSQRFQAEFEEALADAGLTAMTDAMPENGLDDTTEDIGSLEEDADVSF